MSDKQQGNTVLNVHFWDVNMQHAGCTVYTIDGIKF